MCRKDFGTHQDEEDLVTNIQFAGFGGMGRTGMFDLVMSALTATPNLDLSFQRTFREGLARANVESTGEIEERDIQLVMTQVPGVSHQTAESYLRYYDGDIVETILYLSDHKDMPIPRFRRRDRPTPTEPYVSPLIFDRIYEHHHENSRSGYESC